MRCPTLGELPSPPPGKTGWPWTVESPQLPDTMPDGRPWPRISIVTPSYNQGHFIEETVRSVLLQGYPDFEYFVMDGGSTDGTLEVIRKYELWLTAWASEKDRGQGHAINKGFALATGDVYGWINSDDFYFWGALGRLARHREGAKQVLYGDGLVRYVAKGEIAYQIAAPLRRRFLTIGGILFQHSTFWSADLHEAIREDISCAVDSELWFRIVPASNRVTYVNYPFAVVNNHIDAKTNSGRFAEQWRDDNLLIGIIHRLNLPYNSLGWLYRKSRCQIIDYRINRYIWTRRHRNSTNDSLARLFLS